MFSFLCFLLEWLREFCHVRWHEIPRKRGRIKNDVTRMTVVLKVQINNVANIVCSLLVIMALLRCTQKSTKSRVFTTKRSLPPPCLRLLLSTKLITI